MSGCIPIPFVNLQVVQLVQRMAGQLQSNKLQVVFLINNYREVGKWNVHYVSSLSCVMPHDQGAVLTLTLRF